MKFRSMATSQISLFRGTFPALEDGTPPIVDERRPVLESRTYRLELPFQTRDVTIFLTISDQDGRAFEFFLNSADMELSEYLSVVSVLGSRMLRNGFPLEVVAQDLSDIASPVTGHIRKDGYCNSLSHLIGETLIAHAERGETLRLAFDDD
ncbi:MAG: hypothetical protein AAF493_07860 [Pseudomonadota bacterium]